MASSEYTRGEMEIEAQSKMYSGFMKASMWGALILLLAVRVNAAEHTRHAAHVRVFIDARLGKNWQHDVLGREAGFCAEGCDRYLTPAMFVLRPSHAEWVAGLRTSRCRIEMQTSVRVHLGDVMETKWVNGMPHLDVVAVED